MLLFGALVLIVRARNHPPPGVSACKLTGAPVLNCVGICRLSGGDSRFRPADTLLGVVADLYAGLRVEQEESGRPDALHADVQFHGPVSALGTAGVFCAPAQQRSGRFDGHWCRSLIFFPRRRLPAAGGGAAAAHHANYHVSLFSCWHLANRDRHCAIAVCAVRVPRWCKTTGACIASAQCDHAPRSFRMSVCSKAMFGESTDAEALLQDGVQDQALREGREREAAQPAQIDAGEGREDTRRGSSDGEGGAAGEGDGAAEQAGAPAEHEHQQ